MDDNLKWGYDYRFGTVFVVAGEKTYQIKVTDIVSHIPLYALRYFIADAMKPEQEPIKDIEIIRQKTVTDTVLTGKTVLDVGGYMGEFARLALDNGAARAIVLDSEQWKHYGWKDERLPGVEYVKGDLMEYSRYEDGAEHGCNAILRPDGACIPSPDVLILYNILYHLRNPLAYLERAREIIKPDGVMLLCTLFRYHDGPWVYYYNAKECNPTDDSVFFGPSIEALERWLRDTGWTFKQEGLALDRVVYRCFPTHEPNWREAKS